jgi:hypothetical protein
MPLSNPFNAFDSQNNIKDTIEDESIAVLLLIAASGSLTQTTWRNFRPWFLQRFGVPTGEKLFAALRLSILFGPDVSRGFVSSPDRRPVNPFLSALFAEQILPRLAVRTAVSTIMEREPAQSLSATHIVKSGAPGKRLKWVSTAPPEGLYARLNAWAASPQGQYALVSDVIPDAASIDFIRRIVLSLNEEFDVRDVFSLEFEDLSPDDVSLTIRGSRVWRLVGEVSKSCGLADKLFETFRPTENELARIRREMWWDSEQYLRIHAARVFLGLTSAHFSNVLVTRHAQLVSIDHDTAFFENGEDVEALFRFVQRGSEVRKMLDRVAELTEADIRASIAATPKHPACGSADELQEFEQYFVRRLGLWKRVAGRSDGADIRPRVEDVPLAVGAS